MSIYPKNVKNSPTIYINGTIMQSVIWMYSILFDFCFFIYFYYLGGLYTWVLPNKGPCPHMVPTLKENRSHPRWAPQLLKIIYIWYLVQRTLMANGLNQDARGLQVSRSLNVSIINTSNFPSECLLWCVIQWNTLECSRGQICTLVCKSQNILNANCHMFTLMISLLILCE